MASKRKWTPSEKKKEPRPKRQKIATGPELFLDEYNVFGTERPRHGFKYVTIEPNQHSLTTARGRFRAQLVNEDLLIKAVWDIVLAYLDDTDVFIAAVGQEFAFTFHFSGPEPLAVTDSSGDDDAQAKCKLAQCSCKSKGLPCHWFVGQYTLK
jgi:hypothetical protein